MSLRYLGKRLVDFITVRNTITNETDTVPSSAVVYDVSQELNNKTEWKYVDTFFGSSGTVNYDFSKSNEILVGLRNQFNVFIATEIITSHQIIHGDNFLVTGIAGDNQTYYLQAHMKCTTDSIQLIQTWSSNWTFNGIYIYTR